MERNKMKLTFKVSSVSFLLLLIYIFQGEAWTDQSLGDNNTSSLSSQEITSSAPSDSFYQKNITLNSSEVVVGVIETDTANIEPDGPKPNQSLSFSKNLNEYRMGQKTLDIYS